MRAQAALLALLLFPWAASPAGAGHVQERDFQCDGGFCRDGRDHVLDCSPGFCVGDPRGFATVTRPAFDDGAWLPPDDLVLGLVVNGEARAYALRVLTWFETVNDTVGGEPVVVTFCPLCFSGVVYRRVLDGRELVFYNTGAIWRSDLVMYDLASRSWWTQIGGEALTGPLHGARLSMLPSDQVTWAAWKRAHPGTLVMAAPVDAGGRPLAPYARTSPGSDDGGALTARTRVHGVASGGDALAFPVPLVKRLGAVEAEVGGMEVVAVFAGGDVHVWERGGHSFRPAGPGEVADEQGRVYDGLTGASREGAPLQEVPGTTLYWFAWGNFHPGTRVLEERGDGVEPVARGEARTPGPPLLLALLGAALAALAVGTRRPRR